MLATDITHRLPTPDAAQAPRSTVSIVVRTCGGRVAWLAECLASLAQQDYAPLEVVVVEDGGDDARAAVTNFAASFRGSVVYRALPKLGRCRAGNAGLALTSGALLGFLDDDDQLLPRHVSLLAAELAARPEAAAAYAWAYETPTVVESTAPLRYRELGRYVVHRRAWPADELGRRNLLPIQAVLFRRALYDELGGFDETLDFLEDWDLWRRYAARGPFQQVSRVTSLHRVPGDPRSAYARRAQFETQRSQLRAKWRAESAALARPESSRPQAARLVAAAVHRLLLCRPVFGLTWRARLEYHRRRGRVATQS